MPASACEDRLGEVKFGDPDRQPTVAMPARFAILPRTCLLLRHEADEFAIESLGRNGKRNRRMSCSDKGVRRISHRV